jgi:hypothetical protein
VQHTFNQSGKIGGKYLNLQHATNENIDQTHRKKFLFFGVAMQNRILLGFSRRVEGDVEN